MTKTQTVTNQKSTSAKTVKPRRKKRLRRPTTAAKKRFRFLCECALLLALAFGGVTSGLSYLQRLINRPTQVLGVSTKLDTQTILDELNLQRARYGLGPLVIDERLTAAALAKGENMLSDDYWAHVSPDGTQPWDFITAADYTYQSAGENLARDFTDEKSLVSAWMESPTHRANILNGDFTDTGVAILDGQIDGQNVVLIVNLFAQPKTASGQILQTATYNYTADSLVMGGQVITSTSTAISDMLSWTLLGVAAVTIGGVILVLLKLQQVPVSRKKHQ